MFKEGDQIKCITKFAGHNKNFFTCGKIYDIIKSDPYYCWIVCDDNVARKFKHAHNILDFFEDMSFKFTNNWKFGDKIAAYNIPPDFYGLTKDKLYQVLRSTPTHVLLDDDSGMSKWFYKEHFINIKAQRKSKSKKLFGNEEEIVL